MTKTFEMINEYIENGDNVLDIGCRYGELKCFLDKGIKKINYTGIDPQLDHYNKRKLYKFAGEIEKVEIENYETTHKFDKIVISHVLEHVKSPYLTLEKSSNFLKKNGQIILILPNIYTFKFLSVIPFNLENYPVGNDTHLQEFTKMEITNLCKQLKLKIVYYTTRGFDTPLITLPYFIQKGLSKVFPWLSEELFFIIERRDND